MAILVVCCTSMEHVHYLEDFISLEIIHFFQLFDMISDVYQPVYRHRYLRKDRILRLYCGFSIMTCNTIPIRVVTNYRLLL